MLRQLVVSKAPQQCSFPSVCLGFARANHYLPQYTKQNPNMARDATSSFRTQLQDSMQADSPTGRTILMCQHMHVAAQSPLSCRGRGHQQEDTARPISTSSLAGALVAGWTSAACACLLCWPCPWPCPWRGSASSGLLRAQSSPLLHRVGASDMPCSQCACHAAHRPCTASPKAHTMPAVLHMTSTGSVTSCSCSTGGRRRRRRCSDVEDWVGLKVPAAACCRHSRRLVQSARPRCVLTAVCVCDAAVGCMGCTRPHAGAKYQILHQDSA